MNPVTPTCHLYPYQNPYSPGCSSGGRAFDCSEWTSNCREFDSLRPDSLKQVALAHMVERALCKREARGSIPLSYTFFFVWDLCGGGVRNGKWRHLLFQTSPHSLRLIELSEIIPRSYSVAVSTEDSDSSISSSNLDRTFIFGLRLGLVCYYF